MSVLTILQQFGKLARVGLLTVGLLQGAAASTVKTANVQAEKPMPCCCGTGHCKTQHALTHPAGCECGCQMQSQNPSPMAQKPVAITAEQSVAVSQTSISLPRVEILTVSPFDTESSQVITRFANAPPGRSPPVS